MASRKAVGSKKSATTRRKKSKVRPRGRKPRTAAVAPGVEFGGSFAFGATRIFTHYSQAA